MKISIVVVGKTDKGFISLGFEEYMKRINRYVKAEIEVLPDVKNSKNLSVEQLIGKEQDIILNHLHDRSDVILLDERGKEFSSIELSRLVEAKMVAGTKELVFVIGGAYGVSETVKSKFPVQIALSRLTFSHQMVRLVLAEQLYRAMTIIRGEPYHHQ